MYIGFLALKSRCTQYEICGLERPLRMQGQFFFGSWAGWPTFLGWAKKNVYGVAQGLRPLALSY